VRAGAFVQDLFVADAFDLARATFDGSLDLVTRHLQGLGARDGLAEARVTVRIAPAQPGRNRDFARQSREDLAASGIYRALFPLDRCPFRMAAHRTRRFFRGLFGPYA
jgi:hypothetical protein